MVKKKYTEEQRKALLSNKNVAKLGQGVITYTVEFKVKAVKQYQQEYLKPHEIFREAGFDIEMIGKNKPKNCLERWNKTYKEQGVNGLLEHKAGGRPKGSKKKTDKDKIKRLELEVKYLKAENHFLAELRAKRKKAYDLARNMKSSKKPKEM